MTQEQKVHAPGKPFPDGSATAFCRHINRPAVAAMSEQVNCEQCLVKIAKGAKTPHWPKATIRDRLRRRIRA